MTVRARLVSIVTAVLALTALAPVCEAGARGATLPTLYVRYTMNCTFTISDDSGKAVTSIAPGQYQVQVTTPVVFGGVDLSGTTDMTACKGYVQFDLKGTGVDLFSTLTDGDDSNELLSATFKASATYTAQDLNQPAATRKTFTTTATGTPTAAADPYVAGSSPSSGSASTDLIGSAPLVIYRGALVATVSSAGVVTLTKSGARVASLKAGRYTVTVSDGSKKAGFLIQRAGKTSTVLSAAAFVGKRSSSVKFGAGQWSFFSTASEPTGFKVTS